MLEKPFAVNEEEMRTLVDCARQNHSKVMICHVLRYTPFYYGIKERIAAGEIGDIINIQTLEHVSYHHLSTSYVRGKWANSQKCHTSMLCWPSLSPRSGHYDVDDGRDQAHRG